MLGRIVFRAATCSGRGGRTTSRLPSLVSSDGGWIARRAGAPWHLAARSAAEAWGERTQHSTSAVSRALTPTVMLS